MLIYLSSVLWCFSSQRFGPVRAFVQRMHLLVLILGRQNDTSICLPWISASEHHLRMKARTWTKCREEKHQRTQLKEINNNTNRNKRMKHKHNIAYTCVSLYECLIIITKTWIWWEWRSQYINLKFWRYLVSSNSGKCGMDNSITRMTLKLHTILFHRFYSLLLNTWFCCKQKILHQSCYFTWRSKVYLEWEQNNEYKKMDKVPATVWTRMIIRQTMYLSSTYKMKLHKNTCMFRQLISSHRVLVSFHLFIFVLKQDIGQKTALGELITQVYTIIMIHSHSA